ncbi:MAG: metallophosphoesterase [Methylobacter sp.]|nr:metallophosphoesterase [Methylobacter sp.]
MRKQVIPMLVPVLLTACASPMPPTVSQVCTGAETATTRLFLQQVSDTGAIVKWRGAAEKLCVGTDMKQLSREVKAIVTAGEHKEALITGLAPDRTYYYSVGGASTAPVNQYFKTSPLPGSLPGDGNTRIWIVGDSGSGTDEDSGNAGKAAAVRDGMLKYVSKHGGEAIDMFLMLGDNAYLNGSDANYQQGVFDLHKDFLKNTAMWSTIGNHEMGTAHIDYCDIKDRNGVPLAPCGEVVRDDPGVSSSADPNSWVDGVTQASGSMPYLDIYSFPAKGEAGGVASGTEQYYSFNQGNVHVVSLDSQLSARDNDQRAAMRQWLISDLSANNLDWTIVIFHHPPYTKGANHDSDDTENNIVDRPIWDIRNEFVPVFDEYGVDLVYSGHAHTYERSYYLHNHTGTSDTYSHKAYAELVKGDPNAPASGQGSESYAQLSPSSGGIDNRVVYTVNGSSGKANTAGGGITTDAEWLQHPAHIQQAADTATPKRHGLPVLGSVIVDASRTALKASFIDVNGEVLDYFTITR